MQFTIYSYWNMTELTNVFNAVAALVGGPDYGGALKFIVLVAVLSMAMAVLSGRGKMEEFWQWTIMVALLNGFLLAPKATVQLVDQTGTNPPAVVSNVPIGLASLASGISTIGYWLTTSYETVFALPGDLNFETNGMMFGQKVQQEINNLKPATILWQNDFNNFYSQCVVPDMLSGALSQDQINTTSNIWGLLSNTNPGLFVTISAGTMTCPNAYNNLNTRLTSSEVPTTLQNYAATAVPQTASAALAVTKVGNTIVEGESYFNNLAVSANQAVQQGIVSNAIIDAHCNMLAQTSNTAMANECMTEEEGFRQTNSSYQSMANIAQSSMPKLRNAIELIQYAIFPIILIFVIVAGHKGLGVLKTYVMSLMWIQLWPPLYAVVNYMMNVHASYWANATQGNAMALQYQQWISSASVSDQAIAGMLTLSIPAIAAAIVKGGDVGMQAVGNMMSPPHSVEKLAAQMSEGNFGAGKVNMAATAETGSPTLTTVNASGSHTITNADGHQVIDKGSEVDNANIKVEGKNAYGARLSTAATDASRSSVTNSTQSAQQFTAALNNLDGLTQSFKHDTSMGSGSNKALTASISAANQHITKETQDFAHTNGITQDQATKIFAGIQGNLSVPGIKASLGAEASTSSKFDDAIEHARTSGIADNISKEANLALTASKQLNYSDANTATRQGQKQFTDSMQSATSFQTAASADLVRSKDLANKAEQVRSLDSSVTNDLTTKVMDMMIADNQAGKNFTFDGQTYTKGTLKVADIESLAKNNDPDAMKTVNTYAEKIMDGQIKGVTEGQIPTAENIAADYTANSKNIHNDTDAQHAADQLRVQHAQNVAGVAPTKGVSDQTGATPVITAAGGVALSTGTTTPTAQPPVTPASQLSNTAGDHNNEGHIMINGRTGQPVKQSTQPAHTPATPATPVNASTQPAHTPATPQSLEKKLMQQAFGDLVPIDQQNKTGRELQNKVNHALDNPDLMGMTANNAISSVAPDATAHLLREGENGVSNVESYIGNKFDNALSGSNTKPTYTDTNAPVSGAFFNQDGDRFHGTETQAALETAGFIANVGLAATGIGGAAEGWAIKGAEALEDKAATSALAREGAEATTQAAETTATNATTNLGTKQTALDQANISAEQNLIAKQDAAKVAQDNLTATDKTQFGPDDAAMQQQLNQDKLALRNANADVDAAVVENNPSVIQAKTDVDVATTENQAAQDALKTSKNASDKAAQIASDDTTAATAARRAVPATKNLGRVLGGGGGAIISKGLYDALDGSSTSTVAPTAQAEPAPVKPAEPATSEPASTSQAATAVAPASQVEGAPVKPAEPATSEPAPTSQAATAVAPTAQVEGAPVAPQQVVIVQQTAPENAGNALTDAVAGKSNIGNLLGGGQAYVPQQNPEQGQEKGGYDNQGDMPPPRN